MPDRAIDIRTLLDRSRLGSFRLRVILVCWSIALLDGFDVQVMAFVAPVLSKSWNIPPTLMGQVLTASLFGLMLGSVFLGRLSDRIGRRPVMIASVVAFGVGSLVTALSETAWHLILTRCFTGIGLGGAMVTALSLTSEYAPERSRATLVTAMFVGFPLGGSIGGLISTPLIGFFGWQSVFVVGGIAPLLLIGAVCRWLPESLPFRVASGAEPREIGTLVQLVDADYRYQAGDRFELNDTRAGSPRIAELFTSGRLPGTMLIWLICFANLLVLYLLLNWLPSILHQAGMSLARANMGVVIFSLGGVVGGLALSHAVDRLGAFRVLAAGYGVTALIVLALAHTESRALAFVLTTVAGAGIIGAQFCVNALASAFYPTAVRSTGVGWALGVGRIGSIVGPLVGGFALASGATAATIFAGSAIPILVCSVAVVLLSYVYHHGVAPRTD
jgi:AAHS family 4-hydroxybenzoate transporter-like MFS transporter